MIVLNMHVYLPRSFSRNARAARLARCRRERQHTGNGARDHCL